LVPYDPSTGNSKTITTICRKLRDTVSVPSGTRRPGGPVALTQPDPTTTTFSEAIRAASWDAHQHAEHSRFMQDLLGGRLGVERYADLVAQHHFAYEVLEQAERSVVDDPIGATFSFPALRRGPALASDLTALLGPDWATQVSPTPETTAYCDRMREVCTGWAGGFVAHQYVRYLGDLSGGQVIRRIVDRTYGFEGSAGTSFYVFDELGDLKAFKEGYRRRLDDAPWSPDERERIVDEVLEAYRHNTAVLEGLSG
jgi:heme oxygenase